MTEITKATKPLGLSKPKPKAAAAAAINTESKLAKKTDPLRESKEARVQKPESKEKEIRYLGFDGSGKYKISDQEITCDEPFNATYDANGKSLQLRSLSSTGSTGSISFGSLNVGSMFGTGVTIGGFGNRIFIGGVEYVNQKQADGLTLLVPRGSLPVSAAAAAEDEKKKRYNFAENKLVLAKLRRVRTAGSVHLAVAVDAALPKGTDFAIVASGASRVNLVGLLARTLGTVKVDTSGASSVAGGGIIGQELQVHSSGASRITDFHGLAEVDADASGASNVFVTAAKAAAVSENRSGVASATVVRV